MSGQRQLAAIMFTNIVGYSSLMESDERLALEIIEESRQVQRTAIKKYNGELVRETGDQVIASFHSALKAVSCAVFIQKELNENLHLNLRIGIHIGDVILRGDDVFGDCVTIASKIENLTEANSICISEHVFNYIQNIPGIEVEILAENQLNELKSPVNVYKLSVDDYPEELLDEDPGSGDSNINRFLFWQELKRRKVIKVGSMYAAASFAILEAFDILFPAAVIPTWAITLMAVLVIAGFLLTIYLAWVYDFTEEGFSKTEPIGTVTGKEKGREYSGFKKWLTPGNIIIVVLMILIGILVYPKIFNTDKFKDIRNEDGRISIAVMPFKNLTGDTLYNIWQEGLQNLVISTLTNSKELSVRQFNTIYQALGKNDKMHYASLTPSLAGDVTQRLNTRTCVLGSILKTGDTIRITAQLMNADNEEIYQSFQMEADNLNELFSISDKLSYKIKQYFDIKALIDDFGYTKLFGTTEIHSVDALRYYLAGMKSFLKQDYSASIDWLKKTIEIDSNFMAGYYYLSMSYHNLAMSTNNTEQYENAFKWFHIVYSKRDKLPTLEKLQVEWFNAYYYKTPSEQIEYIKQMLQIEDQSAGFWYLLGLAYYDLHQYDKVIEPCLKALEITDNLNIDHYWVNTYYILGFSYCSINDFRNVLEVFEKGLAILPNHPDILWCQAFCALSREDEHESRKYLKAYESARYNDSQWSKSRILGSIGWIFSDAQQPDSALKYFRLAHQLEPSNPRFLYYLANHLIINNINIDEGLELVNEALLSDSGNYLYLDVKGWGLYQLGRYQEAAETIEMAWKKRPHYDHDIYLHLQEVRNKLSGEN